MRSRKGTVVNRRLLVLFALAALAAAGSALAAPSASVFTDPSGDSGAAPDVTEVQVGNDVVAGPIVLWVTAPNRTALGGSEGVVTFLDTDLNAGTGSVDFGGSEFEIESMASGARLYRWDGSGWAQAAAPSLRHAWVPGEHAARIEIHPSDLGSPRAFNFYVVSFNGDVVDLAPDREAPLWSYSLASGPLRLTKEVAVATPARAGRPFTLRLEVGRDDINEILGTGRVACTAKLGAASLRGTARAFGPNGSTCTWSLPRTARGKRISAKIVVAYGGASVSHSYAGVVKR
jgi:hypothetical protein